MEKIEINGIIVHQPKQIDQSFNNELTVEYLSEENFVQDIESSEDESVKSEHQNYCEKSLTKCCGFCCCCLCCCFCSVVYCWESLKDFFRFRVKI
jgi:hypothetical protein